MDECPVCRCPAKNKLCEDTDKWEVECSRCGPLKTDEDFRVEWSRKQRSELEIANLSAWIRRRDGAAELKFSDIEEYLTLRTPTVVEKADALLLNVAKEFPIPGGGPFALPQQLAAAYSKAMSAADRKGTLSDVQTEILGWLSITGVATPAEFMWVVNNYLRNEGYLLPDEHQVCFVISPKGWQRIEQLRTGGIESRSGFVAMNFAQEFDVLFDQVMTPGIEDAGYTANRVGKRQSNERIDDEIIAGIRECRFMVADASGHRPNVYYEAGYAKGLGRDVIWMVEEKDIKDLHFDTRQYPYIAWKRDALAEACKALEMRIAATIGRGPVRRDGTSS